jgi:chromate reductase
MAAFQSKRPRILLLNAALSGGAGNTAVALERLRKALVRKAQVRAITLTGVEPEDAAVRADAGKVRNGSVAGGKEAKGFAEVHAALAWAEALAIGTGTHWDAWSSVLQKFLEDATESEGRKLWLGKPAACVVTEHSVGGKGVLSRLQGVLVTLGCLIPPMSGVVLSKVAQLARKRSGLAQEAKAGTADFWGAEDLKIVAHNLTEAVNGGKKWKAWQVDREEFSARWME